ncbi:MAG: oxygen-independent coproporphyrinogen III oxidase [Deltaproteobacteria bacterium]|nr:oxygen-independent coproporphyrinogen III oxidase [Deltaproteobacteria bacterium]
MESIAVHLPSELFERYARPGPRYTSYPPATQWTHEVGPEELTRRLALADTRADEPVSFYVHLPFCRRLCTYCGCNVVVTNRHERVDRYLGYVAREMDLVGAHLRRRRKVAQLHLGGGTPTFLDERQLLQLWREVTARFEILPEAEVALEADPVVTTTEQLALLRGLGFNRLSMGIQDFTAEVQEYVGRIQSVEQTRRLYEYARKIGYQGMNFDLIYGLPKQRLETFDRTLDEVLGMRPDRVALFNYAHVPWMRPHQKKFDEALIPRPPEKLELFQHARQRFLAAGYVVIGMDHFALPEDELSRARVARRLHRNFQGYTVLPSSDLLAFGVTGISDVAGCYAQNLKPLAEYYRRLDEGRLVTERGWVMTDEDRVRRELIERVMCNFYVDLDELARAHGIDAGQAFDRELEELDAMQEGGLLVRRGRTVEVTPLGQMLVRNIAMVFDPYLRQAPRTQAFSSTI